MKIHAHLRAPSRSCGKLSRDLERQKSALLQTVSHVEGELVVDVFEEVEVEIGAAIARAVEGADGGAGIAARAVDRAAEQHELGRRVALAVGGELFDDESTEHVLVAIKLEICSRLAE